MNRLLLRLLSDQPKFKLSLSITGTFIEQARKWAPDVLHQYRQMIATGRVEIVAETYHHSLAFFYSINEFTRQVEMHQALIREEFGVDMTAFRNTELAYNDQLASWAESQGYKAILAEGWDPILQGRSPNYVYQPPGTNDIRLLLKNYSLSDDVAFRFGNKGWSEWPLTVDRYLDWIDSSLGNGSQIINLFMDYETFGEHQWEDTGIFSFFTAFIQKWAARPASTFYGVTEAATTHTSSGVVEMPQTVTWADTDRDLTAWTGNSLQTEALRCLYELEYDVMMSKDEELIADWRTLQTSDHAYYMCTKWFNDGDVHAYFSPYDSPYDAFLYYMNVIRDMRYRLMEKQQYGGYGG